MDQSPPPERTFIELALFLIAATVALVTITFLAGLTVGVAERGAISTTALFGFIAGFAVLAGSGFIAFRTRPDLSLPKSPKMRTNRILLYVSLFLSLVTGIGLAVSDGGNSRDFGILLNVTSPISQSAAILLIFAMIVVLALSIQWHASLDEHERGAYNFGAVTALYSYFGISVVWWLAWRGGMAPSPDGFVIFWAVTIIWMLGWLYRRFR